jgi:prepilin-type processing-associated H-X9-DG protein
MPKRPFHEIYMMDSFAGQDWHSLAQRKASGNGYGDPVTGASSWILGPEGTDENGDPLWRDVSTRHGFATNIVCLDGHVERLRAEEIFKGNWGDYDCRYDGLTGE